MENFETIVPPAEHLPTPQESDNQKKTIIVLAVLVVVLLIVMSTCIGYLFYQLQIQSKQTNINIGNLVATTSAPTSTGAITQEISWISPQQVNSLGWFNGKANDVPIETNAKYYKVGTINSGRYQGGELYLVSALMDGPSTYPGFYGFVKQGEKFFYLENYSSEDNVNDPAGIDRSKVTFDNNYVISQLVYPDNIVENEGKINLQIDHYVNAFFESGNLKKVMTDPKYGDIYTSAVSDPTNADIFGRDGFYLKAPDGTLRAYALYPDFVSPDRVPGITWLDGKENTVSYDYTEHTGCGSANYAEVMQNFSLADVKVTGKTTGGDNVYEYLNINNPALKDFYNNTYQVMDGEKKVSYATFIATHPIFFWQDGFGRYLKFASSKYGPIAECGKPVIYLYPEQTENVSVKVEPRGGMSYSDPVYNDGWEVVATPASKITEVSSGKVFPYLFWEGSGGIYEQPKNGFVIKQSEVHNFLIEKLALLGLNKKESADFIEFWEPRMQGSPYYFVTFLGTRDMNRLAPLTIEPKPDTIIRILMDFSPLEKPIKVNGYEIKTPIRKGFTAVEWGGVIR